MVASCRIEDFYVILWNTVVLTLSVVAITFVFGMIFALLLDRPFAGRSVARTMLISPFLVMPVVTAVLWKNVLLDPVFGFSAYLLKIFGLPAVNVIEQFPMASVVTIVSWQWIPFVMLILLAGLQSLPESAVEAASIDGASGFSMFRYIIMPHLRTFIEIALLLEVIFVLNVFGVIFVTTSGGPGIATTNLPYEIYKEAFLPLERGSRQRIGRLRRSSGQHRRLYVPTGSAPPTGRRTWHETAQTYRIFLHCSDLCAGFRHVFSHPLDGYDLF